MFAAEIADEDDKFFTEDRFQTGYWVCPDIDQIYLLGQENVDDPPYYFQATVTTCNLAKKLVDSPAYDSSEECAKDDEIEASFDTETYNLFTYQISQYFNPKTYLNTEGMDYMAQNFNKVLLTNEFSQT